MDMKIEKTDGSYTHVVLSGKMDVTGCMEIEMRFTACVAAPRLATVVELGDVDFMSSLGMRMLLTNAKALKRENCRMLLVNPQETVKATLQSAGLDKVMAIYDTVPAAIDALRA